MDNELLMQRLEREKPMSYLWIPNPLLNDREAPPHTLESLRRHYHDLLECGDTPVYATEAVGEVVIEAFSTEPEMKGWLQPAAQMLLTDAGPPTKTEDVCVEGKLNLSDGKKVVIQIRIDFKEIHAWIEGEDPIHLLCPPEDLPYVLDQLAKV